MIDETGETLQIAPAARRAGRRSAMLASLAMLPGLALFGFRAALVIACVLIVYGVARRCFRRRSGPAVVHADPPVLDALLLCGLLPSELASRPLWPIALAAPILLALLRWGRAAVPRIPFDCVVLVALVLHVVMGTAMMPTSALEPGRLFRGDIGRAAPDSPGVEPTPWYARANTATDIARRSPWAAERLDAYLSKHLPNRNLDSLIRDALPPIEDLVLIGHPTPIGMASGIALLGLVLWGAFHRTIDWRIPLVAIASFYVTLLILPVPSTVSADGVARWRLAAAWRSDIGPATALTFVHYVLFASPALFTLGLLAPRGDNRPVQPHAVMPWSFALGIVTAALTLYVSVIFGPLLALAPAAWTARVADRLFAQRPLRLPA